MPLTHAFICGQKSVLTQLTILLVFFNQNFARRIAKLYLILHAEQK